MSQLIGYLCSDDSLTHAVMREVSSQLQAIPVEERAGLGLGWVQEGRTLLRKHPRSMVGDVEIGALLSDLRTRSVIGHVSQDLDAVSDAKDLQPFRFRNWVYAQSELKSSEGWEAIRDELETMLPDHIRRNMVGKTLPELFFHVYLLHLKQGGVFSAQSGVAKKAAQALAQTAKMLVERSSTFKPKSKSGVDFAAFAASERLLVCARTGEPVYYRFFQGIEGLEEEPLFAGHRPKSVHHPHFRALVVATKIDPNAGGAWQELPEQHVLWVAPKWQVMTASFDEILKSS